MSSSSSSTTKCKDVAIQTIKSTSTTTSATKSKTKSILCVGMCVLDIITVCEKYPEEDSDKRCLNGYWQRGGNASNNCTVLNSLGAKCEFLGMLSKSVAFGFLLEDNRKRNISIANCPQAAQDPPFSSVILAKNNGTRTIVHSNSNFPILKYEHFRKINLNDYSWIHFEARNPDDTIQMLHDIQKHNAAQINCDVNVDATTSVIVVSLDLEKLRVDHFVLADLVDYVFLGKDLAIHMGWLDSKAAVYGLRNELTKISQQTFTNKKKRPAIICPWSAVGTSALDANDNYEFIEAAQIEEIVDSLGAGDTFCAATIFAIGILKRNLKEAVEFGNRCAGYKLKHRGFDIIEEFAKNEITNQ